MTMDDLREHFSNLLEIAYGDKVNASMEEKIARMKQVIGPNTRFAARGGEESPALELACLEYTYIISALDPMA